MNGQTPMDPRDTSQLKPESSGELLPGWPHAQAEAVLGRVKAIAQKIDDRIRQVVGDTADHSVPPAGQTETQFPLP